jgi:hypothetical protein
MITRSETFKAVTISTPSGGEDVFAGAEPERKGGRAGMIITDPAQESPAVEASTKLQRKIAEKNVWQLAKLARRGRRRFNGLCKRIQRCKLSGLVPVLVAQAEHVSRIRQAVAAEYGRRSYVNYSL